MQTLVNPVVVLTGIKQDKEKIIKLLQGKQKKNLLTFGTFESQEDQATLLHGKIDMVICENTRPTPKTLACLLNPRQPLFVLPSHLDKDVLSLPAEKDLHQELTKKSKELLARDSRAFENVVLAVEVAEMNDVFIDMLKRYCPLVTEMDIDLVLKTVGFKPEGKKMNIGLSMKDIDVDQSEFWIYFTGMSFFQTFEAVGVKIIEKMQKNNMVYQVLTVGVNITKEDVMRIMYNGSKFGQYKQESKLEILDVSKTTHEVALGMVSMQGPSKKRKRVSWCDDSSNRVIVYEIDKDYMNKLPENTKTTKPLSVPDEMECEPKKHPVTDVCKAVMELTEIVAREKPPKKEEIVTPEPPKEVTPVKVVESPPQEPVVSQVIELSQPQDIPKSNPPKEPEMKVLESGKIEGNLQDREDSPLDYLEYEPLDLNTGTTDFEPFNMDTIPDPQTITVPARKSAGKMTPMNSKVSPVRKISPKHSPIRPFKPAPVGKVAIPKVTKNMPQMDPFSISLICGGCKNTVTGYYWCICNTAVYCMSCSGKHKCTTCGQVRCDSCAKPCGDCCKRTCVNCVDRHMTEDHFTLDIDTFVGFEDKKGRSLTDPFESINKKQKPSSRCHCCTNSAIGYCGSCFCGFCPEHSKTMINTTDGTCDICTSRVQW